MNLLFVNGCMRRSGESRTHRLADAFLTAYQQSHPAHRLQTLSLRECAHLPASAEQSLQRIGWMDHGDLSHPVFDLARTFAASDQIVIAAPYWDLSFPALLKVYLEAVCVSGITFRYENDKAVGLCRAKSLVYLTTCGGYIGSCNFGFDYIKGLCRGLLGIRDVRFVAAEGLDIDQLDPQKQLQPALLEAQKVAAEL
ncbi:MAG: NAD(P)H-dependent oxidoreductase [Oscillospiraceae bacterium]|jgi:FMN-dependent NADH-azoreductase